MALPLVNPLEDPWRDVLDLVLEQRRQPKIADTARLGPKLAELSRAYNAGLAGDAPGAKRLPLAARIAFSFPRDVPKGAAAVRELVSTATLSVPVDRPLRVLDLGAGLGAMSWGVFRALDASGARGAIQALLVDEDEEALEAAEAIAREASLRGRVVRGPLTLSVTTRAARLDSAVSSASRGPAADLVLVGQVLSELDTSRPESERVERHASLLASLLRDVVAPSGSLVVVEPALRNRSRHLAAVRDRLAEEGRTVFAPCLHARACPCLATAGDWCHEDLAVDLPRWLVPLARAAALRYQGLTFSYLVLRNDEATLRRALPGSGARLRAISSLMRTKGKSEIWACTDAGERLRVRRLDRDRVPGNEAWDELERGAIVTRPGLDSWRDDGTRIARDTCLEVWPDQG